ncbi:MAG: D-glycero-beta-D-manno-heptose 1-phosphate adenylyltransferase [Bacteroidetes bacterium]|nr:D-glycero-beta-D-manno-heptose 1-phosphate adenylyltransferase [Bacteroidota bacterium]
MNQSLQKIENKIVSLSEAKDRIQSWQKEGLKVVFTNGCFDLLHKGHIHYLCEAAALGDKLVLGLNSDASVRRLKGASRPINNEESRAAMLACFFFIDLIVFFEEETPETLINTISPDVLVKGGDYNIKDIVGADHVLKNGGKVLSLSFIDGFSSTDIINKIKQTT